MTAVTALALAALPAFAALAACGERGPAAPGWSQPDRYEYTLTSTCGERLVNGKMRLTVQGGEVVQAVGLDEGGRGAVETAKRTTLTKLPTLKDLIDEYESARRRKAHMAKAQFDPGDGHPIRIDLDIERNAIDDEACYAISDYSVS